MDSMPENKNTKTTSEEKSDEIFEIHKSMIEGDHLDGLKWLHNFLLEEAAKPNSTSKVTTEMSTIPPKVKTSLEDDKLQRLMKYLDVAFDPKTNQLSIPSNSDSDRLKNSSNIVAEMIFIQIQICRSCDGLLKNIMKHLKKTPKCMQQYSEDDYKFLLEMGALKSKLVAAQWQRKNKKLIAEKKAKRYQEKKNDYAANYQRNKADIAQKRKKYEAANKEKIAEKKAKYYLANKEHYAKDYQEKKETKKAVVIAKSVAYKESHIEGTKMFFAKNVREDVGFNATLKNFFVKYHLENIDNYQKICFASKNEFPEVIPQLFELEQQLGNIFTIIDARIDIVMAKEVSQCKDLGTINSIRRRLKVELKETIDECKKTINHNLKQIGKDINCSYICPQCMLLAKFDFVCKECKNE